VYKPCMTVEHDDDLFAPALAGKRRRVIPKGERPWRLSSQLYVAFFGGALAVTAIAWLNARRLGVAGTKLRLIPLIGLAGLVATVAVVEIFGGGEIGSSQRILARVVALATGGVLYGLQVSADRVYHAYTEGDEDAVYDSLWRPGLAATFGLGIVQALLLVGALELV
jgi:hypothetical protein